MRRHTPVAKALSIGGIESKAEALGHLEAKILSLGVAKGDGEFYGGAFEDGDLAFEAD